MYDAIPKIYRFDSFRLDTVRRELLRDGDGIQLPAKAFDLLVLMVENNGRLMEREELFKLLWPGQFVEESNLSVNVSALRKALGKTQYIQTIPRQGYRFIADVGTEDVEQSGNGVDSTHFGANDAEGRLLVSRSSGQNRPNNVKSKWSPAFLIGVLLCLSAAAVGFGYLRYTQPPDGDPKSYPVSQMSIRRLTFHGRVVRSALSSDGKYFAYVREDKGMRSLWLGQTGDGSSMQLRPPSEIVYGSLVFGPDDSSIYCVGTSKGQPHSVLYRMSVLGEKTETVLENLSSPPAFSPDGKQIAFVRNSSEKRESILLAANAADGKDERVLATRDWAARFTGDGASWSPDGKVIALAALSSDSNNWGRELLGVQFADGTVAPLTGRKSIAINRVTWLHDGSGLVMIATDKPASEWLQLWHLSYPEGEMRQITKDLTTYNQSSLSLSSDNSSILAVQLRQTNNIWLAPAAKLEEARQVTFGAAGRLDGAYGLDWAPDGRIFYTASTADGMSIWSMNADGSETKPVTPAGFVERRPSLTNDGRFMVFESSRNGSHEVWRSGLDGGQPQQLTTGGKSRSPHVAPNGEWVVYASTHTGTSTIWRVPIEGGEPLQLTDKESDWPRISPDGKQFACFYRQETDGPWQLGIFDIQGGQPLKLFDLPNTTNVRNGPRWTPDGSAITYRDWKEGIWLQPLRGGDALRIPGLPKEKIYPYAWSPDASQFAFVRGDESYDVILISNFN